MFESRRPDAIDMTLLTVSRLCAGYGTARVLFDVDLVVGKGELVGLLGRNGMGKTTTLLAIMGGVRPSAGAIRLSGRRIDGLPPHAIARLGVALVPEGRRVFADLTVRENLLVGARPPRDGDEGFGLDDVFALFPRLFERREQRADRLSGGEQQMLAIGRALMTNPALLLLDEATEGLAPLVRKEIWRVIAELAGRGQSLLVVDKDVRALARLAHRFYVLERGRIVFEGTPRALLADRSLLERHLGV
ncbi:MAG: ABC transporter ATP-binding protein [Geminicoccaceae bacterium]|nr:ABC transporter ATP-binding protein [Geminicoccaceae bacterium]MCS7267616.1 ABC transporter ATP-binding protein [Geminicoccaceae bacterium]MCX7630409.1 ABC transporter ATP-binding protein [Geminicoccaceae bacterium]MDW8123174.1 ABC transporter ATP-binding protein [Geminicoccaceae bacterium]MDW8340166.1 ABC transporter ATP-binding protein [Geminicoccaceae bacterium]